MTTDSTIPVLLDTDIGSDVDDALSRWPTCWPSPGASCWASPPCQASRTAAPHWPAPSAVAAGRGDVPVHVGPGSRPSLAAPLQPHAPQAEVLSCRGTSRVCKQADGSRSFCGRPSAPGPAKSPCWRLGRFDQPRRPVCAGPGAADAPETACPNGRRVLDPRFGFLHAGTVGSRMEPALATRTPPRLSSAPRSRACGRSGWM